MTALRGGAILLAAALLSLAPAPVSAAPPHGDGGHVHHVVTGNGDCLTIDQVTFLAQDRGLHRGASASGTGAGPWHGGCP